MAAVAVSTTDDVEVRQAIARSFGSAVRELHAAPAADGSYDSRILSVELADGAWMKLFLKDFAAARAPKRGIEERAAAEIGIYRRLLRRMELGTARYYGSGPDRAERRTWLLLEFVEGRDLHGCGAGSRADAAAWLAQLQAEFRARELLAEASFLPRHDAAFFATEAGRAVDAAASRSIALAARLDAVLARYDAAVELMLAQPPTLVQGKFRNVVVSKTGSGRRICPLDWEPGAIGAALYDLAFLVEGLPEAEATRLTRVYDDRARALGLPSTDLGALRCFRLHRALGLVRKAVKRSPEMEAVEAAVGRVEALAARP